MGFSVNTPYARQIWTASGVLISLIGQGMVLGYTSCLLPALKAPDSPIKTDINSTSWIASVNGFANVLGTLLSSYLMDRIGRRRTYFIIVIPATIGWILIYIASNISTLIVARILGGISAGATTILGAIIIGEYTCPKIRGILLNFKTTALCVGSLLVHAIGDYFNWRTVALLALIPHVTALFIIWTWVESPAWLASRKQFDRSEKDYLWIRGDSEEAKIEFEELIAAQKKQSTPVAKLNLFAKFLDTFKCFGRRNFLMPVTIVSLGGLLLESCGRHTLPTYAKEIIGGMATNESQGFYFILIIDSIVIVCTILSSVLIKIMNRRTLLFSTGVPAFPVLLAVSLYLFMVSKGIISGSSWIAFTGFAIFVALSNMGCTILPYVLVGEVFPLKYRGSGTTLVTLFVSITIMVYVKLAPYALVTFQIHGTLGLMAIIIGITLLLLYFLQPETKDKTLQQIEDYFTYGEFKVHNNGTGEDAKMIDEVSVK